MTRTNIAATIDVVEAEIKGIEAELQALAEARKGLSPPERELRAERKKELQDQLKKQESTLRTLRWENAKTTVVAVVALALIVAFLSFSGFEL